VKAVDNISIAANAGEIVSVIGPNGAGKTTLFEPVSGRIPAANGRIFLHAKT